MGICFHLLRAKREYDYISIRDGYWRDMNTVPWIVALMIQWWVPLKCGGGDARID